MSLEDSGELAIGKIGESQIAQWLRSEGWHVLPVYEKEVDDGKGPRLFLPGSNELVAPDMLVFRGEKGAWVEAKHKSVFSWHRATNQWVTGIDKRHYEHYLEVQQISPWNVWLMFLHRDAEPAKLDRKHLGVPKRCPTGLFTCCIDAPINHEAPPQPDGSGWGSTGMVYWGYRQLYQLARMEDVLRIAWGKAAER